MDVDVVDQHLKLLGCDSSLDRTLLQIAKYSHYKLEKVCIPEVVGDANTQRLAELEQLIVRRIDDKMCTLAHDALGHFALIVGYKLKSVQSAMSDSRATKFKFKVKGYVGSTRSGEYSSVDLLDLRLVILMQPPPKEKRFSLQHALNPQMLQRMVCDLVLARRSVGVAAERSEPSNGGVHDLLGMAALERMSAVLQASKATEVVSASLGKLA